MNCIFCKVANKEIPSTTVYEDELVVAFKDIHPVASTHILVVSREHIGEFYYLERPEVMLAIQSALKHLIKENDLMGKGYRIETNGGGAQIVDHLHFHLIGPIGHAPKA